MRVLVTGAPGFVGQFLCADLKNCGHDLVTSGRNRKNPGRSVAVDFVAGKIDASTDWSKALENLDAVVHLAARVHVMSDTSDDPLTAFREVNTLGTERLALQAAGSGVKRFVYISSIKVNGNMTTNRCFRPDDDANPDGPYGVSKWEAEQRLHQIAQRTGMQVVIVRPPLVYGPGVKGNFLRLLKLIKLGIPLPFGSVENSRSLVSVYNLCDFLRICLEHPAASDQVFLVSDGEDLPTRDLIFRMGKAMEKRPVLLSVPVKLLYAAGWLVDKQAEVERLCESLKVDTQKAHLLLNWRPPLSVEEGLRRTARWYMSDSRSTH